jgi:sporulation integral membrane protein YtvI
LRVFIISTIQDKKRHFIINSIYYAIIIALIWFVIKYMLVWIAPFLFGYFIAVIVQPVVNFLTKTLKFNRKAAGIISVLAFIVLIGLLLTLGLTRLIYELISVFNMMPRFFSEVTTSINALSNKFAGMFDNLPTDIAHQLIILFGDFSNQITKLSSITSGAATLTLKTASMVPGLIVNIIITIVSACFISCDYIDIRSFMMRQLPEKYQKWSMKIKDFFFKTIARFIRAYLILMLITFLELCICLSILGVPHAIMISAMISLVDILPVLGTGSVVLPWAAVEIIMGNVHLGVLLILMYLFIFIIRNILEPKIVGYHIGLYPLCTLIAMFIGYNAFGAVGLFLLPIAIIIIKHMQDTGEIRMWKD